MKITDVKLITLELPASQSPTRVPQLVQVPNLRRIQYRAGLNTEREPLHLTSVNPRENFLEVHTDQGIVGRLPASTMEAFQVDLVRSMAIGENPLHRERLYQMFHKGTRWVYQKPGWFGDFDNCLWDIAGKAAGLPLHSLIGKVRDRFSCYLTGDDMDLN